MPFLVLTVVLLAASANASFLRSNSQQQQQRNLEACPSKQCYTVSFFQSIDPGILETDFECTSAANCASGYACLYDNTKSPANFVCEENLDVEGKCNLLCVQEDVPENRDSNQAVPCLDNKMCLPLATLNVAMRECNGPEDCALGECRYNTNTLTTVCDTGDDSLCSYDCVEDDSMETEIP